LGGKVDASGVSQHGFALNVRPTAELLGEEVPGVEAVAETMAESFGRVVRV
jgi:hypothetical protein